MSVAFVLQKLPMILFFVISSIIIYQMASLTWLFLPFDKSTPVWVLPKATGNFHKLNSATDITAKNIFGVAQEEGSNGSQDFKDAPLTNLNLKIVGLVAASIPHYSSTIIDDAGQQTSYFVGSKIKGTSATISSIFRDRIILNVNGNMQALLFDKNAANKHVADQKPQRTVKINRQAILKNPQKLNDYIKISVVAKNGKIIGYRVNPGHDKSVFESAGLVPGDIAVRINGVDLTNQQQSLTLLRSFPTLHKMSLTVNRKGKFYHLNLHLP